MIYSISFFIGRKKEGEELKHLLRYKSQHFKTTSE